MADRGRVVLPAPVRRALGLAAGDQLILTVEPDGAVRMVSAREVAGRLRGLLLDVAPGRSLVDELPAERRAEARREDAERDGG
jgi:AbrB family looped-hinge helix DNA binding protein